MDDRGATVFPFLRYADAEAAIDWLTRAFGFRTLDVSRGESGAVQHAELALGPGVVMLGQGEPSEHGIYVAVPDPDAHYSTARAAGARIKREIADMHYGSREYTASDLEGKTWSFGSYRPSATS
jgi:uncharacterized glyoxalase superfamily protein PhnB